MTHHRRSQPFAESPACAERATVLVGYLAEIDDHSITIMPSLDGAYSIEIQRRDVLAFDTVRASGACRVVTSVNAVVVERRTVSVVHSRALTARELFDPEATGFGVSRRRA